MKVETPQIIWHSKDSKFADRVYSLDFQPGTSRLATAGADEFIHIWEITREAEWKLKILSRLLGHEKEVNCVRFSSSGELLASGGQDDSLCIWKPTSEKQIIFGQNSDDILGFPEYWKRITIMKCMAPVISLSWSPDNCKIVVGTEDDRVTIWNVYTGKLLRQLDAHTHIIMGVSWDPKDQFIASQSSDQTVRIWKSKINKIKKKNKSNSNNDDNKIIKESNQIDINNHLKSSLENNSLISESSSFNKTEINNSINQQFIKSDINSWKLYQTIKYETIDHSKSKQMNIEFENNSDLVIGDSAILNNNKLSNHHKRKCLFLAESATTTFFRRLDWSPNGEMLVVPTGQYLINQDDNRDINQVLIPVSYIFLRDEYSYPAVVLPSPDGTTSSIRFNPVTFSSIKNNPNQNPFSSNRITPNNNNQSWFFSNNSNNYNVPRYIFSVITLAGTIYIYDTQHLHPIVSIRGLHFQGMNDASWSSDGHTLAVASSDGYITFVFFENGELGDILIPANIPNYHSNSNILQNKNHESQIQINDENYNNQNKEKSNDNIIQEQNQTFKVKRRIVPTILVSYDS